MNCRELAVYSIIDVLENKAYTNLVLKKLFKQVNLTTKEKAFITELVNGTIRNLIYIDYIINYFSNTKTKKMKPLILNILRISIYQICFMKNIPHSAICNEAVKLTKAKKFNNLAGFVNAITRNTARNIENINLKENIKDKLEYISTVYSTPKWILDIWSKQFDLETIEKICKSNLDSPKTSICINTNKTTKQHLKQSLENEGILVEEGVLSKNSLCIKNTDDISRLNLFKEGYFHIMDESSMICVEALGLKEDKVLIDVCSAPGGKAFYSAYIMKDNGEILARDIHLHKIDLINDSINRLQLKSIKSQILDATFEDEESVEKADYLLVDAPCSGLGILKRKPDIKYNKKLEDIEELIKIQRNILAASHKYLKIGGTLVYSTCTINIKENEENVQWFCDKYGYELQKLELDKVFNKFDKINLNKGCLQILPYMYNTDGFFIAKMKRKR